MGAAGNVVPGAGLSNFNNLGLSSQPIGPDVNSAVNAMGVAPSSTQIAESTLTPPGTYGQMSKGFGEYIKDPFGEGFEAFKQAGGEGGIPLETGEAAMKLGSPVAGAALSLYEPPMPKPYIDPDTGKYRGPEGQLNLGDQFDTGLRLATGGTIQSGGIRDLYGTPDNQPTISPGLSGFGLGRLNNLAGEQAMTQAQTLGYAEGGEVGMNLNDNTLNLNLVGGPSDSTSTRQPGGMLGGLFGLGRASGTPGMGMNSFFYRLMGLGRNAQLEPKSYALNLNSGKQEAQYAQGGYLDGQGDGMSDSIPATIEGKQPARLADGEFVIPADVVSHIGNGSSKAGSKRLYAMLDKVRHARTGNKKQGKQIKADKYLPA
jgi:hypothetical protein